ncbi:MAG TPA: hypothetical protein VGC97_25595 [Pyrinomonadaceae bacterium]|jgi:hypothetical protein
MKITLTPDETTDLGFKDCATQDELSDKVGKFLRERVKIRWSKFNVKPTENKGLEITID